MYGAPLCMTHSTNFKLPKCGYMSPGAPSYCQPQIPQIVKNSVAQKPGGCCTHKMVIGHMCHPMIFVGSSSFIPMIHPHDSSPWFIPYILLYVAGFIHVSSYPIFQYILFGAHPKNTSSSSYVMVYMATTYANILWTKTGC